jgi:hypothetical protein
MNVNVERNKGKWLGVENGKGNMKVMRQLEKRLSIERENE